MFSQRFQRIVTVQIKRLQRYTGRSWYAPLIGLLSALDNIVVVIPNDGILISSSMLSMASVVCRGGGVSSSPVAALAGFPDRERSVACT